MNQQEFEFGSLKEAIAILAFARQRDIQYLSAIFPVVSNDKAQDAVKKFRGVVFPDTALDDALYLKKAKEHMKKLLRTDIRIKPADVNGELSYRHVKRMME